MKIVVWSSPKFLAPLLRMFFKIDKEEEYGCFAAV